MLMNTIEDIITINEDEISTYTEDIYNIQFTSNRKN